MNKIHSDGGSQRALWSHLGIVVYVDQAFGFLQLMRLVLPNNMTEVILELVQVTNKLCVAQLPLNLISLSFVTILVDC